MNESVIKKVFQVLYSNGKTLGILAIDFAEALKKAESGIEKVKTAKSDLVEVEKISFTCVVDVE